MSCVLLADRHHELSEGVRGLLATAFDTVFAVADAHSLLEGAARIHPDLVVFDISLAGGDVAAFVTALKQKAPAAKVLVLTVHDQAAVGSSTIAAGADGVVLTRNIAADLLDAVETVLEGGSFSSICADPLASPKGHEWHG